MIKAELSKLQLAFLEYARKRGNNSIILRAGKGRGKTLAILALCDERKYKKILVICPKEVIPNWKKQILEYTEFSVQSIEGNRTKRQHIIENSTANILLINPQKVRLASKDFLRVAPLFDVLIIDELSQFRRKSGQVKEILPIAKAFKSRIGITASLITQKLTNVFTPYLIVDLGRAFGTNYYNFREKYCKIETSDSGSIKYVGTQYGKRIVRGIINATAFDVKSGEYEDDLPKYRMEERYFTLSDEQLAYLQELRSNWELSEFGVTYNYITQILIKAKQIESGFFKKDDNNVVLLKYNPRSQLLGKIIDEIGDEPFVIWHEYIVEGILIKYLLHTKGISCAKEWMDFQDGKAQAFIGSYSKHAKGIELHRSNNVVLFSRPWNNDLYDQALGRSRRKGSEHSFVNYTTITCNSVGERHTSRILRESMDLKNYIEGIGFNELWESLVPN